MSVSSCCISGFEWEGTPTGRIEKLDGRDTYVAGDNKSVAVLVIADLFGWSFPNIRLLADHYAREANATVYVPDFFDGELLPRDLMLAERYDEVDIDGFLQRHGREARDGDISSCARALRRTYQRLAAIGFCYGGWAAFRLGSKEFNGNGARLMDCIMAGHPSQLTKEDIDSVAVPVQILAPELDWLYTEELKMHTFKTLQATGVPFDYQHFPGVQHACLVRGNEKKAGERAAMARAKNAAVAWMKQHLHPTI